MHAFPPKLLMFRASSTRALLAHGEAALRGAKPSAQTGDACLCIVVRSEDEARTLLLEAASLLRRDELPNRVGMRATLRSFGRDALVGMLPGQGSQAKNMLQSLAQAFPRFAAIRSELDRLFATVEGRSIVQAVGIRGAGQHGEACR